MTVNDTACVLVVDDQESNARLLRDLLARVGYRGDGVMVFFNDPEPLPEPCVFKVTDAGVYRLKGIRDPIPALLLDAPA